MPPLATLEIFRVHVPRRRVFVPLMSVHASCGFPSPADDHLETDLDPTALLIRRPSATFFIRAAGISMDSLRPVPARVQIHEGDLLVVDRAEPARHGSVVVVCLSGDFFVKRLVLRGRRAFLQPENEAFSEMEITGDEDAILWGVVTWRLTHLQ